MKRITLPLMALALAGAAPLPLEPAPSRAKPRFLETQPLRDELRSVEEEVNRGSWVSIGGSDDPSHRRHVLLKKLASAQPDQRQRARWDYARYLISVSMPSEANGVLTAMAEDEPELATIPAFQAVRALAYSDAGRFEEAVEALNVAGTEQDSHFCLFRSYAYAKQADWTAALVNWPCAIPAANRLSPQQRIDYALPIVRSAWALKHDDLARNILSKLSNRYPEVSFWKGMYAFRDGQIDLGTKFLSNVRDRSHGIFSTRAELELVRALHAAGKLKTNDAIARLEALKYSWRGTVVERDLLLTLARLEDSGGNLHAALGYTAPLVRYPQLMGATSSNIRLAQGYMSAALAPTSRLSLNEQAAIYWDYRDLAPQGLDGDAIIRNLAAKMAAQGLTTRAADLLERQIRDRLNDAAPVVAVQVARWRLLSGQPEKAIAILDDTNDGLIPSDIKRERQIAYLYALLAMKKGEEAMALLDGEAAALPTPVKAELYWQGKEWRHFIANNRALFAGRPIDNLETRGMIVRQAIAASTIHDETELQRLAAAYGPQFASKDSPLGSAFRMLTGAAPVDPDNLKLAMADIDKASPQNLSLGWVSALSSTRK